MKQGHREFPLYPRTFLAEWDPAQLRRATVASSPGDHLATARPYQAETNSPEANLGAQNFEKLPPNENMGET